MRSAQKIDESIFKARRRRRSRGEPGGLIVRARHHADGIALEHGVCDCGVALKTLQFCALGACVGAYAEDAPLHTRRQSLRRTGIEQASLVQQQNLVAALCFVEIRGRPDDSSFRIDEATHHRPQFTSGRGINPN